MFCNHRCYQSFLAFNSIKKVEQRKEFEACSSSGSFHMARGHRKRLFLQRGLQLVKELWCLKERWFVSHTELCLQLKTGFLTLKDVMLTALLKPIMGGLDPECLASSGAWCIAPSIQLELALLHWCWPLQGGALIYTGYKIASKYNSFGIRKMLTYCSCICLRLFSEQWMLQKVYSFILY